MRHFLIIPSLLLVAGCAATPRTVAPPATPPSDPARAGALVGLDAAALNARFGTPRLQVIEGSGIKLQYAHGSCLLDFYLYPPAGGGAARVVHVDSRDREGRNVDQAACVTTVATR